MFFRPLAIFAALAAVALSAESRQHDVLVQFHPDKMSAGLRELSRHGVAVRRVLPIVRSAAVRLSPAQLERVRRSRLFRAIHDDSLVKQTMDDVTPAVGAQAAYRSGWTGSGIGVAVIDSGISTNADLPDVRYQKAFTPETVSQDVYGHGSHVAGIIGGRGANSSGSSFTRNFRGIAPGVHFVSLIALDRYGKGRESDVIAAIAEAIRVRRTYNIRVMNLSLGKPVTKRYTDDLLCSAVEAAWRAGIVVVVSAGNAGRNNALATDGYGTITSPGNSPFVITVGAMKPMGTATRSDDVLASYSSKGPTLYDHVVKPDLVAPGNKIVSVLSQDGRFRNSNIENCVPLNYYISGGHTQPGDKYFWMSGTSMAAPVVSGAAALLLQKDRSLTPDQVKFRLMKTAAKSFPLLTTSFDAASGAAYNLRHDPFSVGAGYLDIVAALNNTEKPTLPALSPKVRYNTAARTVEMRRDGYATSILWGDSTQPWHYTWGPGIVSGTSILWGDSVLWGDSLTSGFSILWGETIQQAHSVLWGDSILWGEGAVRAEADELLLKGDRQ
jgi:serine protease AprX